MFQRMIPSRLCSVWLQQLLVLTIVVLKIHLYEGKKYVELEGIQIPFEKSSSLWTVVIHNETVGDSDNTCMNTTTNASNNTTYHLNGAGVRSFSLFQGWSGGDMKIYVASFYKTTTTIPLNTSESIYNTIHNNKNHNNTTGRKMNTNTAHLLFDFTFLRTVNQRRVTDAWKFQLHHSIGKNYTTYPEYNNDYNTFIHSFGPIQNGGTVSIILSSNGHTYLYDPGYRHKSTIIGYPFQLAFVSMWFGTKPVATNLKNNLLGNYSGNIFHSQATHKSNDKSSCQQHHNTCNASFDE